MPLQLQLGFANKVNSTMVLAQQAGANAVSMRVASLVTDILGTVTATGAQGPVVFSLSPETPPWVTGQVDQTGTVFTVSFSNALPNGTIPFLFYVSATDGITYLYVPVMLDVKPPLSLGVTNSPFAGKTVLTIPSWDPTVADIEIQGLGLNSQPQPGISFMPPAAMPPGLEFLTSDGTKLVLHVSDPAEGNVPGGLQTFINTPNSTQLTVLAYAPGYFYDEPDRAFTQAFTVQSLTAKQGTLDFSVAVTFDTGNYWFRLDLDTDFLQGQAPLETINILWAANGTATGTPSTGTGSYFEWTPSGAGTVSFTVTLQGATSGYIYGTKTLGPIPVGGAGGSSWETSTALKLAINSEPGGIVGYVGDTLTINVSSPAAEFNAGENITVTFTIEEGSAYEAVIAPPSPVHLTAGSPSASATVVLPASNLPFVNPFLHEKWGIRASASSTASRTGFAEAGLHSAGLRTLIINSASLTGNTGSAIVPYQLTASDVETTAPVAGIQFSLVGAPGGLNINAAGQIVGDALAPGSYTFKVLAEQPPAAITTVAVNGADVLTVTAANSFVVGQPVSFANVGTATFLNGVTVIVATATPSQFTASFSHAFYAATADTGTAYGYADSLSGNFTLVVTQVATPLAISNPHVVGAATIPAIEVNNTPFIVAWGITGTPEPLEGVLFLQSGAIGGPRDVTGVTQASTSQPTSSVIAVYGSSFYGNAYALPLIVLSSSIQAGQQLLPSPTIGTIDEDFNLTLNWQPYIVAGGYSVYRAWDIYLNQPPALPPLGLQTIDGNLPTGLEFPGSTPSNRIFEAVLAAGDWNVTMTALTSNPSIATNSNAWDNVRQFPAALTPSSVTLSSATLQIGQSLAISLAPSYSGAQYWSVTYPDGTTTGFIPIGANTRSVAKAFSTPGPQDIVVQTEYDFSTGNPPVKLRRQITLSVYVTNQLFTPQSGAQADLTGTLGIGGQQGFEIVDASTSVVTPEPWEVINRSLVRDTVTNELKLMVATSRFASASSLLDTMALDVFPIQGRPLSPEFVDIPALFAPTPTTSAIPVRITTATLPAIIVGKPMTVFPMTATGGTTPYNWFSDGSLPLGLQLTQDGTLFGTPLELGAFGVNFAVQDSSSPHAIASATLSLQINTDLAITTPPALPPATVNQAYAYNGSPFYIANTGGLPPFAWSVVSGALPTGLSINAATGQIQGVAVTYNSTTDFTKTYSVTIQVKDTIGATAQALFTMRLLPAALEFGVVDQQIIHATEQYKLVVPVFGGHSPYTLTAFTDDGIIGSGLQIVSPPEDTVTLVAGETPPVLTLTTSPGPTPFYPAVLPQNISFDLSEFTSDGTPPYNWSITPTAPNTLPQAVIYGSILTGHVSVNGNYTIGVTVVDSIGHIASGVFTLSVQRQNAPTGSPQYLVFPVAVSFNGTQNNPFNWSVLPITNPPIASSGQPNIPGGGVAAQFPQAQVSPSTAWTPQNADSAIFAATGSHTVYQNYQYFGVAVYQNGVLHMTQNGAASKVWAASTTFNLGDTVIDTNGNLEIVTAPGTSGTVEPGTSSALSSAGNASAGNTTYNGSFSVAYPAGFPVVIAGFSHAANNGTFTVVSCTGLQLTVNNPVGTSESHAATAAFDPWSTVGGTTGDGTVTWTETTTPVSPPMVFFDVAEDEEPGGSTDPGGFPHWLNPQSGTTVAGGAHRDFSGIILFNVSGGSNPVTVDSYSWLSLFTTIVSTNGSLQNAAQRTSVIASASGEQSAPPTAAATIVITDTDVWPIWYPGTGFVVGNQILDINGNIQQVTAVSGTGLTGSAVPSWNKTISGTTSDHQVTWTNEGPATPVTINLTTLPPPSLTYPWYVPIIAEGGAGGPYTFQIVSTVGSLQPNPTTLPNITLTTINNLPAFASNTTAAGAYQVTMIATDSAYTTAVWQASTAYSTGQLILDPNGNTEKIVTPGTSGGSQPSWNTHVGGTTGDNGMVWQNIGKHASLAYTVPVTILETATQQVHILNNNLPTAIFGPAPYGGELGRPITPNTYFIQSDLVSYWLWSNLPSGVSFTTTPSNRSYLQGTPTVNGVFNVSVTAVSASYGTSATFQFTLTVTPRGASLVSPPTQATVGIDYRAVNNNALLRVAYTGYQPGDPDLPLLFSSTGTVGAPGVLSGGLATTQVVNLTPGGFTMLFDYQDNVVGTDTVTLKHNLNIFATAPVAIVYPVLVASGTTPPTQSVSEYAVTAVFAVPIFILGGNPPYSLNISGESDARFVPINNPGANAALQITVSQFAPGGTYSCQVSTVVTDTESTPMSSTATGTLSVAIVLETYITVNYNNQTWAVPSNSAANIYYLVLPNGTGFPASSGPGVTPLLGHPPFSFNVTSVSIPGGLSGLVTVSPSKRVIAINTSGTTVSVNDVSNLLTPQGGFNVSSTASPSPGSYTIGVGYQVIDAHGITSTGAANVVVNIS